MRMTSTVLAFVACIAIAGCRETASCVDGRYDPDTRACTSAPRPDSGADAAFDAGDFCDTCEAPSICDRENLECDECMPGAMPTTCPTDQPVCDSTGHCVECEDDQDCSSPVASHCVDASCVPCAVDLECSHVVDGTTMLDACDAARTPATCVECTEADEIVQCATGFGCDRTTGRCADTERTQDLCDACTHDYDCLRGRRCVEMTVGGSSVGTFCLFERSDTQACGDTEPVFQPYSHPRSATSVDGADGTFCFPPAGVSCQTLRDYNSRSCTTDADCGLVGVDDGDCPPVGGRCSYTCGGDADCRDGANCSTGSPPYCRPDV